MWAILVNRMFVNPQVHGPFDSKETAEMVRQALTYLSYVKTANLVPLRTTELIDGQLHFTAFL